MNRLNIHPYSDHWNGGNYKKISSPQFTVNMRVLSQINFSGNERILDIGCGSGDTTSELARFAPQGSVLGVDASQSMINEASATHQQNNVSFKLMNALDIDFANEFDLAVSFFCLQWIHDKLTVFQKIYRSLKNNGKFVMVVPMPHPHLPAIRREILVSKKWCNYFSNYKDPLVYINDADYKTYVECSGLIVLSDVIELEPVYFENYKDFQNFMYEMTPHLSCLPNENLKMEFLQELSDEYLKIYPPSENGVCRLDFNLRKLICNRQI